jgi:putative phosphoribosyl transferase
MAFADRRDAGRQLAERLEPLRAEAPVVVGMARGGVTVAAEVADRLGAPLDVIVVRKIGCPWHQELGVGALAEGGTTITDPDLIAELGIRPDELETVIARERDELARRVQRYRGDRPPLKVRDRVVVLVDDGLATGGTARAAIAAIRARGSRRIVLAVPVAPRETLERMRPLVDAVEVISAPLWFGAIGEAYLDFGQVPDEEVVAALDASLPRAAASQRTA